MWTAIVRCENMHDLIEIILRPSIVACAIACFGSFTWSIRRFFVRPSQIGRGMKMIQVFGLLFMVLHLVALLFFFQWRLDTAIAALFLYVLALALFWWAVTTIRSQPLTLAFSADAPEHLVATGPYRWIRHPLYTAYAVTWLAGIVATFAWWLTPSLAIMGLLYWRAAQHEEGKFASSSLGELYNGYATVLECFHQDCDS